MHKITKYQQERKKERKKTMLRRMCGYIPYLSQLGENLFQQRFEKDLV